MPADLHRVVVSGQRRQQYSARNLASGPKLERPQTVDRLLPAAGDPPVEYLLHVFQRRHRLTWLRTEPATHLVPAVNGEGSFQIGGGPVPGDQPGRCEVLHLAGLQVGEGVVGVVLGQH